MNVDNNQDTIDSRDVIDRINELSNLLNDRHEERIEEEGAYDFNIWCEVNKYNDPDVYEYLALCRFQREAYDYAKCWDHGEILIRHTYFKEYCKELCEDLGEIPKDIPSYIEIDWDATAENLRVDYTEVDFDGVPYYVR